jgi:CheY-like chemotaxis protein
VQDVERMLQRVLGEHIEFRTVRDPDAGWIEADRNQMEGILLNLATNARDAMLSGGVLSIETARIEVAAHRQPPEPDLAAGSYVRLTVRDTGLGMDGETQQHLFEPFFTTKQKGKGTGLGLSSVYAGVEQNRGRIFVASTLGKGTTFSVYIPRLERMNVVEPRRATSDNSYQGTETILLVEDESAVRRMLREALTRAGYRVREAGDGAEAIQQWGGNIEQIDLVVTDIVMPVMNGLKLAEELKTRRPSLKVIFMSGHAEEVIHSQSGSDLAPDILQKPFVPETLVRKVREVLNQSSNPVHRLRRV